MKAGIKRKLADTGSAEAEPVSAAAAGGSPGAKHKSSSKATKETLDRSAYVPTATVEKHNWASSSMREYAKEVEDELLYSGLALIHIPVNSRGSELGNVQRLGEMGPLVDLLEQARPGKMATYRYSFEEVSKGAYKIKYKTMGEGWRASKWYEHSEELSSEGPFSTLPTEGDFDDEEYWKCVRKAAAPDSKVEINYPADIHASVLAGITAFPLGWNMAKFDGENDLLRAIMPWLPFKDNNIPGYTDPMLYVGAAGSSFLLHSEDQNLYSCNYLQGGAPKIWYGIPPAYYKRTVEVVREVFADISLVKTCPQAVMHKQFLLHPDVLRKHGIPVCRVVQRPGDMVITAPGAFHFGYNSGFNVAEATNFANAEWWTGGHYHDALAMGHCKCKEAPRFHFPEADVREGLQEAGATFGVHSV